ncbi:MAG: HD domain-containing protein [Candidatus Paceibacterota bacterium]|jgi:hypothetical protein
MILKDPLYGFISIGEPFKSLMDTEQFQRLRNIKQLGQSYIVYSSANHTRFEHSIGTYYLAQKVAENNAIENKDEFIAAALLHDIGHYPFSHSIEKAVRQLTEKGHEQQSIEIIRNTNISKILRDHGLDIELICNYIEGKGKYASLISGQIDVDRMDYLKRDSYYTGVAYGIIESDVIINNYTIKGDDYIADIKYLPAFESVLIARYLMYSMVYMHHRTIIANTMLRSAFIEALNNGDFKIEKLIEFDDIDLISRFRSSSSPAKQLMDAITKRNLYKEAIIFSKDDFEDAGKMIGYDKVQEVEALIAKELKLNRYEVLINIMGFPKSNKSRILISPSMKKLEDISPIVSSLNMAEWNHWFAGVYCQEKDIDKIRQKKDMIRSYLIGK